MLKNIGQTVVVLLVSVAVIGGAWFAYWAIQKQSTENRYDINTGTQQYQSALISQERDRVTAYDVSVDEAQKKNIASTFCAVYSELTNPTEDLSAAERRICN